MGVFVASLIVAYILLLVSIFLGLDEFIKNRLNLRISNNKYKASNIY